MTTIYALPVTLAIVVPDGADPESYLADAANEILRGQQMHFTDNSCLIDYSLEVHAASKSDAQVEGYEEGDF